MFFKNVHKYLNLHMYMHLFVWVAPEGINPPTLAVLMPCSAKQAVVCVSSSSHHSTYLIFVIPRAICILSRCCPLIPCASALCPDVFFRN